MFPIMAGNSASTGYNLTRSLRFRASASAYLNRTPSVGGNQNTWTYNAWVKLGTTGNCTIYNTSSNGNSDTGLGQIYFYNNKLNFFQYTGGVTYTQLISTQVFRDYSAWYMITVAYDDTQAIAANRVKMYVNGVQITSFTTAIYPTQNFGGFFNGTQPIYIGRDAESAPMPYFDGYLAEVNFIDGQALTPSSFGSTNALTGVWQPAKYSGTYGTNGFYLPFTDNSALTTSSNVGLGKDFSGNGNYWTTNNISITAGVTYDSMTDVPTLTSATAANFAVFNPLEKTYNTGTPSNGNLTSVSPTTNGCTIAIPTDGNLYYFEFANINAINTSGDEFVIGVHQPNNTAWWYNSSSSNAWVAYASAGGGGGSWQFINNGTQAFANGGGTPANTTFGCAVKYSGGTWSVYISRAGVWYNSSGTALGSFTSGSPTSTFSYTGILVPFGNGNANFGQQPFTYTPPTGFVALNTYNLPTSTILQGNKVMDATLYTGNGGTITVANAASFKPDLVWTKSRSTGSTNHLLTNSITGNGVSLQSNNTGAEGTRGSTITSTGFSYTYPNEGGDGNYSGQTYVGWQWQAGQGTTSSNTNGTITSTVSVNASAGFSVVTYTGTGSVATVGHGLGVAPSLVIVKVRSTTNDWVVYHSSIGNTGAVFLDLTNATSTSGNYWNNTSPTSSNFSIGVAAGVNNSGSTFVAYCWTPIAGYSAFGSYTGNSSTDGTFVYTGFRPKFVMIKEITTGGTNWNILDTSRDPYNVEQNYLAANSSAAEGALGLLDGLSNGFKLRNAALAVNLTGSTYIYMAFAENPTKYALAR